MSQLRIGEIGKRPACPQVSQVSRFLQVSLEPAVAPALCLRDARISGLLEGRFYDLNVWSAKKLVVLWNVCGCKRQGTDAVCRNYFFVASAFQIGSNGALPMREDSSM